ncbi:hypothetical protein HHK36_019144 [Tetracentron sinense]|uniref:UBC core domain-containing protein n=1 Tax=Tetracentron sinense TaxID=13715 RepID=A0A834YYR5_TETSI|nr:hypothetical protein HHK36_019144 [Tetracentron sinense]
MEVRYNGQQQQQQQQHPPTAPSKQPKASPKSVDPTSVSQRLQKELMSLMDKWSSAYDCRTILLSIQSLLGEPNIESPLNSYAAALWDNHEDYRKMVHKQYVVGEAIES